MQGHSSFLSFVSLQQAQLQREEQAKDAFSMMSKKLEVIALEFFNKGWKHLYCLN